MNYVIYFKADAMSNNYQKGESLQNHSSHHVKLKGGGRGWGEGGRGGRVKIFKKHLGSM